MLGPKAEVPKPITRLDSGLRPVRLKSMPTLRADMRSSFNNQSCGARTLWSQPFCPDLCFMEDSLKG